MESLVDFALQERYKQVKDLGNRLGELATLIEWEPFREIVGDLYTNTTEQGGRPNIDVILMIKLLVLQSMYWLSDPELERQANDKISFLRFLGFPEKVPDQTTVWYFRERLSKTKKDKAIWNEPKKTERKRIKDPERCNSGCDIHHGRSGTCIC
jgi:IS5 family transposase